MTVLTMRYLRGHFVVTGPDIEPMKFKSRREARDWCIIDRHVADVDDRRPSPPIGRHATAGPRQRSRCGRKRGSSTRVGRVRLRRADGHTTNAPQVIPDDEVTLRR